MTGASEALTGARSVRLPVGIFPTIESRETRLRHVIIGVIVVAILVTGGLAITGASVTVSATAGAAILILGAVSALWGRRKPASTVPLARVEVSVDGLRCRDLVRGKAAWGELTSFRWVQSEDIERGAVFSRSDGRSSSDQLKEEGFVIEAAGLADTSSTNEHGYYDNPAIQFDFDDLCVGGVTRTKADEFVNWINVLQLSAVQGKLADLDSIQVPAWLNAASVDVPEQRSFKPSAIPSVVRR